MGSQRPVSTILEQPSAQIEQGVLANTGSQDSTKFSFHRGGPTLSAKAAGKRPAVRSTPEQRSTQSQELLQSPLKQERPAVVLDKSPSSQAKSLESPSNQASDYGSSTPSSRTLATTLSTETPHSAINSDRGDARSSPRVMPRMVRSRSNNGQSQQFRDLSISRAPTQSLVLEPTVTTTTDTVAAQGTMIDFGQQDSSIPARDAFEREYRNDGDLLRRSSTTSLFTPTQPSSAPVVPLGRTKSQLTLLLERDQIRSGDKSRSRH
jgi:hypothetical protein